MTTQHFGRDKRPYTIEYLRVDDLTTPVNTGQVPYQRDQGSNGNPHSGMEARTAKYGEYDHRILRFREISRRSNGVLAAMDGNGSNHWLRAMFGPDYLVPCKVYEDLTLEEEAKMFELFQHIKQVGFTDRYNADVIAKETTALKIKKVFEEYGFNIGSRSPSKISYSAAKYAMDVGGGEERLRKTIQMVTIFPDTNYRRTNSELFKAICDVIGSETFTEDSIRNALRGATPEELLEGRNGYAAHNKARDNIRKRAERFLSH